MDVGSSALGFPSKKKKQNNGAYVKNGLKNNMVQENGCHVTCRITVKKTSPLESGQNQRSSCRALFYTINTEKAAKAL
ncbi:MAG: hypothetical protein NDI81_17500 [Desulfobacula sp.]|nr:hypothetical protein [Desulfobacula sp.]MDA8133743.1 hypothetical protein [Desulfobacteraceae bacterium]